MQIDLRLFKTLINGKHKVFKSLFCFLNGKHSRVSILLLLLISQAIWTNKVEAQCSSTTAVTAQNATNTGAGLTLNFTSRNGSYEQINNAVIGMTYVVSSSSSTYFTVKTVSAGAGGTVITSGTAPVTFTATATTIYIIINSTSSCGTASGFTTATLTAVPSISSIPSSACAGSSITITGTAMSGVTSVKFNGSGTTATPSATTSTSVTVTVPAAATTGTITVTSSAGSGTSTSSITINPKPGNDAGSNVTICGGGSTILGAAATTGNTYSWSPATGLSSTTVSNPTASPPSTTTYTLVETITATGCSASNNVTVTVNASPTVAPTATPGTICSGQSSTLAAHAVAGSGTISTYAWSSGLAGNVSGGSVSPTTTTTYSVTVTNSHSCTVTGTVTVNVNSSPTVAPTASPSVICMGDSTALAANATAGTDTIFSYAWSSGLTGDDSTGTVAPASTTTYRVTVTNLNSCSVTGTVSVTVNANPTLSPTTTLSSICNGQSASLAANATAGSGSITTYAWSSGLAGNVPGGSVMPLSNTTYYVTVSNSNSCSATDSVSVGVINFNPPTVAPTATPGILCSNDTATLDANATEGDAGIAGYAWSNGLGDDSTASASPISSTTYSVTVSDSNSCSAIGTIKVNVYVGPSVAPTASPAAICNGQSSTLSANATAGNSSITAYAWSSGLGNDSVETASPSITTIYTVTVSDSNTCTTTATVTVSVNANPTVAPTATPGTICSGHSSTLAANATAGSGTISTYAWSSGLAGSVSGGNVSPTSATTYTVTVTNSKTCSTTGTVMVNVNTSPGIAPSATPDTICSGQSTALAANATAGSAGISSYAWSSGLGSNPTASASPTITTTYSVTVSDSNSCSATGTIKVNVNANPSVAPTATPTAICGGASSTLAAHATAGSGSITTYAWSSGLAGNVSGGSVSPTSTTTYIVTVTNSNTCSITGSVSVSVNASPTVAPTATPGTICSGQSSTLAANATAGSGSISTYTWSSGLAGNVSGGSVSPTITTIYTVKVTNSNGCSVSGTVQVNVNSSPTVAPTATSSGIICGGGSDTLAANATAGSGSSITTYAWSSNSGFGNVSGGVVSPSATTTYTVTVTNSNSCSASGSVTVILIGAPIVAPTATPSSICSGQSSTLAANASGGFFYTYIWSSGLVGSVSGGSVSPTSTTTYSVTVYGFLNPCPGTGSVTVTVNPAPTVTAGGPDTFCQSASPITYALSGSSVGGAASTAAWSITSGGGTLSSTAETTTPDTVSYTPAANFSGIATLTLTSNPTTGCSSATATRTVNITATSTVTPGGPNSVCQSASPSPITLSGASVGGGATKGAWSITSGGGTLSSTSQTATPATVTYTPAANFSGTVTLTLTTNAPGACPAVSGTRTINVNAAATVTPGGPDTVCEPASPTAYALSGASVGGGATTGAWSITSGGGTLSSTAQTANPASITYTPAANFSGTVTLTLTSNSTGTCPAVSGARTVIVNRASTVTPGGPDTVCESGSPSAYALSGASVGGGATTGAWSITSGGGTLSSTAQTANPASVTYTPAANFSGTATLTLTSNSTGTCPSVSNTRTVIVNPASTVTPGGPDSLCQSASPTAYALFGASVGGGATTGAWSITSGGGTLSSTAQTANPASVTYTAVANFSGTVTLTLTSNSTGTCPAVSGTRTVIVNPTSICSPNPTISCPPPVNVSCASDVPAVLTNYVGFAAAGGTATVTCGGTTPIITWLSDVISNQSCANQYTITRTYQVSDSCGNTDSCAQTIIVNDTTAPVITNAPGSLDTTLSCSDASGLAAALNLAPTATDNCTANLSINLISDTTIASASCANAYTIIRTWNFTDACNNTSPDFTQTINVIDTTPPVITTSGNISESGSGGTLNANLQCNDTAGLAAALAEQPTATDACTGNPTIHLLLDSTSQNPSCPYAYTRVRIWDFSDGCGNTSTTFTQVISVSDSALPVILTCAADTTINASDNCAAIVPDFTSGVTATDNCTPSSSLIITQSPLAGTSVTTGSTVVTITVQDACGNSSTCQAQLNIVSVILAVNDSGSADGYSGGTAVNNVLANDLLNCSAVNSADVNLSFISSTDAGLTLSDSSAVVAPGTAVGTDTLTYQICEIANPTNCSEAIVVVTVTAPALIAVNDTGSADGYSGGVAVADVLANDSLNGAPVNPSDVNLSFVSSTSAAVTLSGSSVVVAAGTAEETDTLTYQICEVLNPASCSQANAVVTITAPVLAAVNDSGSVDGFDGGAAVINVLANDSIDGSVLNPSDVTLSFISSTNPGITLNGSNVVVASGTSESEDTLTYQICEMLNPSVCSQAIVLVSVTAPVIVTAVDSGSVDGYTGGVAVYNVLENDLYDGSPATLSVVNLSFVSSTSPALSLSGSGAVVVSGTSEGIDTLTYQICDQLNPTNCQQGIVIVTVLAPVLVAVNDTGSVNNAYLGGTAIANVLANDSLDGAVVDPSDITLSFISSTNPGVTLDDTSVVVSPGTGAGIDTLTYQICEVLDPSACAQALAIVNAEVPEAALNCAANDTVASCQTQDAVNTAFAAWLNTFSFTGGCDATSSNDNTGAPLACGGSTTVTFSVSGDCQPTQTCSATFTVSSSVITLTTPANDTVASCQTQDAINSAFTAWLNTFTYSGGCSVTTSNDNTGAPLACGGSTTVDFTLTDTCQGSQTVSASFTVSPAATLALSAPANDTVASCQTQAAVDAAFTAWLNTFSFSGGCSPISSNDNTGAPSACGGSTTVNFTLTDSCQGSQTVSASFTVNPSSTISLITPANDTVASCQTQGAVDTAFATWLNTFSYSGGCNPTLSNDNTGAPSACGGNTTVNFTLTDSCQGSQTVSASFAVNPTPTLSLNAPANDTVASCLTQGAVDTAFAAWLNTFSFSGNCNSTSTNDNTGAPSACGGSTTVDFTVSDACQGSQTVSANFTVKAAAALSLIAPANDTVASCQTQAVVDTVFAAWLNTFSFSGDCSSTYSNNNTGAPLACGGSTTVVFTVTDACQGTQTVSASFAVNPAATLSLSTPANDTVASCQTQAAVNTAFAAWLNTFSFSGGCSPTSSNNNTGAPAACGGSATVTFTVNDSCQGSQTVSASFTVNPSTLFLNAPANDTVASCQTQGAIDTAFAAWVNTFSFSGGCNPTASNDNTGAPLACGGSTSVNFTVNDSCQGTQTVSATFTVPATSVSLIVANDTVAACQTQDQVNAEFSSWLTSANASGGCNTQVTNNSGIIGGAPLSFGGSITITFTATSSCADTQTTSATFTVQVAVPVVLTTPLNDTIASCQSQPAVDAEFTAWLNSASTTVGLVSNNNTGAPSACGGSTTVTFIDSSLCQSPITDSATFAVPSPALVTLTAPADDTVASCQTQGAIDTAFAAWLNSVSYSGGCSPTISNDDTGAPSACGGSTTVHFTLTDTCQGSQTVSASFTVNPPSSTISLTAPANDTLASCQTQGAIDTAFAAWLNSVSYSGGCSPILSNDNTGAPSACGGNVTVDFTLTDVCQGSQTVSASFTVNPAATISLNTPANDTVASCQTQAEVDTAFAAWLNTFTFTGGCSPTLSNDNTGAPSGCGGSTTVNFTLTDVCQGSQTVSASFTVNSSGLAINTPANDTVASCQTQGAVDTAFANWLNTFTFSGGCSPTSSNDNTGAPVACGGSTTVNFTVSDICGGPQTVSASFAVNFAGALSLNAPANDTVASCQTQGAIDTAFAAWLNTLTYSGGCNPIPTNDNTGAPLACGGITTVDFTVSDSCSGTQTVSATFTVPASPVVINTAANDTTALCLSQDSVNAAFAAWLGTFTYSGGCNAISSNDNIGAPLACGGTTTVDFTVTDNCSGTQTVSASFTVPAATSVSLIAANDTVAACETQDQVNAEFNSWLTSASATGGCNTQVFNNSDSTGGAPSAGGGGITIIFTATSSCSDTLTTSATFTVPVPAPILLNVPANDTVASCLSQDSVNAEFAIWLASASANEGIISNNNTGVSACGGSTTVTFIDSSNCQAPVTDSANFTVLSPASISVIAPLNDTIASCQTQGAVDTAFTAWLNTFTVSGGCNPILTNDNTGAPSACGGSDTVNFTLTDVCQGSQTVSATFTVNPAPAITLIYANDTVASCQTPDAVNSEYNAWLATFSLSGGCSPSGFIDNSGPPSACGGSTSIDFTVTDVCSSQTVSPTFAVIAAPAVVLNVPANDTVASCQTQGAVDTAFTAWLNTFSFSGGCSLTGGNDNTGAPIACGGSTTVDFIVSDICGSSDTVSATFTVSPPPPLVLISPVNDTVASCQASDNVELEYGIWLNNNLSYSGGCNATASLVGSSGAPGSCGGTGSAIFTLSDVCGSQNDTVTFTVNAAPALTLTTPANDTVASCQTQVQVDSEFTAWLGTVNYSGGCNSFAGNDADGAPSNCGGTVTVDFSAGDICGQTQSASATFTVNPSLNLSVNTPANDTVGACQTQDAVNEEFNLWLASASASGGCNTQVSNNSDSTGGAPLATGGSVTITFTATSSCSDTQSTSASFTVPGPEPIYLTAPVNDTVASCQTQGAVDTAFAAWLNSAISNGGAISNNNTGAPSSCGGSATITFIDSSTCQSPITDSAIFTVTAAPQLTVTVPPNDTVASGQSQDSVNAEFTAWLDSASASGGCNAQVTNNSDSTGGAPPATGGSVTITFTATSSCPDPLTDSATFTVLSSSTASLTAPSNDTVASCQTQGAVDTAFAAWLNSASATGGSLSNNNTGAPSSCGGSTTVTFTDSINSQLSITDSATFAVLAPSSQLTLTTPANDTVASCQSQDSVNAQFAAWLDSASASGGCSAQVSNNSASTGGAPSANGGSVTITFTATSLCSDTLSDSATFTVPTGIKVYLTAPLNDTVASCQSQDSVNAEFAIWLTSASATGGSISNNNTGAPSACGGSTTVTFKDSVSCSGTQTASATFTVPTAPQLSMGSCSHTNLTCNASCNRGVNTGSVTAGVITNACGKVSYYWVNSSAQLVGTTATVTGLPMGKYTLTVHDNCTTLTCSQTISQPPVMTLGPCSTVNLQCNLSCKRGNTGSVIAGAISNNNGPVSYYWISDATAEVVGTTATVSGLPAGGYTLSVFDSCSELTCSATILSPPLMTMGECSSVNLLCNSSCQSGNTGSVSAGAISNANGPVSYYWINDANAHVVGSTATVSGLPAGTYTLTASDNCSSVTCTVTITQPPLMAMGACSRINPSCKGTGSVSAGAITNANGPVSYYWVNDANAQAVGSTATLSGLPAGTYTLTVRDNCSALTCTETISQSPVMTMGSCSSVNLSCNSSCSHGNTGSVSAGTISNANGPVSYFWVNDSTANVVGSTATVSGLPAGTYTLTVHDNCTTLTCTETISQPPVMTMDTCSSVNLSCNSVCKHGNTGSVRAGAISNANGPVSYYWVNDATTGVVGTTASVSGLPAGTYTLTASDNCSSLTCTVMISQPPLMTMGACSSSNPGCGSGTGSVSAGTITNANGPVTYSWVNNSTSAVVGTTATVYGLPAGTYTLTASDNCSSATCSETISVPSIMTMSSCSSVSPTCGGGTGKVAAGTVSNANGTVYYSWANTSGQVVGTSAKVNGLPGGTYTLTVHDNCTTLTCTESISPAPPAMTMDACSSVNLSCNSVCKHGNTGSVSAGAISNAFGPVSYYWVSDATYDVVGTTATVSGLPAGTYTLTVYDNCTTLICTETISDPPLMTMGECSGSNLTCGQYQNGSVSAGAISNANGPVSYNWVSAATNQPVGTTSTLNGLPAGTYTLTASDNCSSVSCSVSISQPLTLAMGLCSFTKPGCNADTGSVSAGAISNNNGPVSYTWTNSAGQVVGTTATVTGLGAGTYNLTASDNCNSVTCSVIVSQPSSMTMGSCSSVNALCYGGTGSVSAGAISNNNGRVYYSWLNSSYQQVGTTATVSGLPAGTYTLTASDNCAALTCSATISAPQAMTMGACSSARASCNGGTGSVSAGAISNNNGPVTYSWLNSWGQFAGSTATVNGLPAGTYTLTASDNCSSVTCSATISAPPAMTMGACSSVNLTCNLSCHRGGKGSVSAGAISNANGPVSYYWVNDSTNDVVGTTATVNNLMPGTYTLTVFDNCTTLTCSVTVSQPPVMTMGACSRTNASCGQNNGSVSAGSVGNPNGPISYSWVNNANSRVVGTTATVSGLPAGTYVLTVSDNCSSLTCSETIIQLPVMTMGACSHVNTSCNGNGGSVSAGAISNNNGPVSYSWVNSSNQVIGTTATVTGLSTGTYTLTIHDNCTTLTCTQTITGPPVMTMGACSSVNLQCNSSCKHGNTGSVSAGAISNNNGPLTYSWKNASNHVVGTTATVSGLPAGTYTLTVSDNCSTLTCSTTISQPLLMTMGACSSVNLLCHSGYHYGNTGSVSAGAITNANGPVSYYWVNDATAQVVGTTATVSGLPAGTYTLTASDNCSSVTCTSTISSPTAMTMGPCSHTNTTCNELNGSVSAGAIANANGPVTYTWINNFGHVIGTTATVSGLWDGTYNLTVRDNCSTLTCSQTILSSAVSISCSITSEPTVGSNSTVGNPDVIYLGYGPQSTQLVSSTSGGAAGPYTYSWSPATNLSSATSASPLFTPTIGGMYTFALTVTSAGGCTSTCDITICVLDIRVPAVDCGRNAYGSLVYLCQSEHYGHPQTIIVNVSDVAHYLSAYNDQLGSCNQSCGNEKADFDVAPPSAQDESNPAFDLLVYPNPFITQFHLMIQSESTEQINLKIYDITGQLINVTNDVQRNTEILLGGQFAAGVYFVEVNQGEVKKVLRMIKGE